MKLHWNWFWALPGSGERFLGLDMAFSKSERFPGPPLALSRGTFRLLLKTMSNPRKRPPKPGITQISYTGVTFWLDHVEKKRITIDYLHSWRSIPIFWVTLFQYNFLSKFFFKKGTGSLAPGALGRGTCSLFEKELREEPILNDCNSENR